MLTIRNAFRNLFPRAMEGIYILPEMALIFVLFLIRSPFGVAQKICIENIKNVIQKRKDNPDVSIFYF